MKRVLVFKKVAFINIEYIYIYYVWINMQIIRNKQTTIYSQNNNTDNKK